MRYIYYLNQTFNAAEANRFIDFMNSVRLQETEEAPEIDIYINSDGGELDIAYLIKDILEKSNMIINLIANNDLHSAAFILFYTCKHVNKFILDSTYSIIHTVSRLYEDRELRGADTYSKTLKKFLDEENNHFLRIWEENNVMTISQIKKYKKGEDIILSTLDLKSLMKKCPYGNYFEN